MTSRVYWLWLATRAKIGPRLTVALLEHFGGPEEIYAATRGAFLLCDGLNAAQIDTLCDKRLDGAERILETCTQKDFRILTLGDSGYPERLRNIYDPPIVLYLRGRQPAWDARPVVSIVGTRRATAYGEMMAERFARSLTESGFLVASGMADGIDAAANRGALRASGQAGTIAVLGCGVDVCYPPKNSYLFGDLIYAGTLVSEFPPGSEPIARHFPQRNRIMSGLSVATLVIEAPMRSGALITAHLALDQGRDVYAMPGRLDEPQSAGCNALIRDGEAVLLSDPLQLVRAYSGILRELPDERLIDRVFRGLPVRSAKGQERADASAPRRQQEGRGRKAASAQAAKPQPKPQPKPAAPPAPANLSPEERKLVEAVRAGARTTDQLIQATGIPAPQLLSLVTMLELDGIITNGGGVIALCE